ncbi:L-threonylcarbamoyladenylate synthase [Luteipulveratus sp. YIM 133132]|uniref:L-threonylcarbamoyladenylate synthase n=1 Tax=Luteipulveratus flavus TaxID=3031728 RepID=A0ABT6C8C7_9MICO|nr:MULTISPECIES: L-threonylcarbamoyladenylate synthase [unclassified Luteipulveratus]MDE9365935.1 L-threonylcarbamoyladenylate synthase [Luteipulveratus sp. YIM 133132]MDF8265125.1 L-threonylcarbamoyladenylate synthase [Luteipulveratus sp. YIM 133296]
MSPVYDCSTAEGREDGLAAARQALGDGRLVVLPTDTVYGLAADAFNPTGVTAIFTAKGRGRDMPPPVLVPNHRTVDGLAMAMPAYVKRLMKEFWPGGLTLVVRAQQSLSWDLGDTNGTVGLRMPDDELTLALLAETGPLAVSSANRTGQPAATTATDAGFQLGPYAEVYLDDGPRETVQPSTIVDCTKPDPVVLREGAVSVEQLREVLGDIHLVAPDTGDDGLSGGAPQVPDGVEIGSSADVDDAGEPSLGQHWHDSSTVQPSRSFGSSVLPPAEPVGESSTESDPATGDHR